MGQLKIVASLKALIDKGTMEFHDVLHGFISISDENLAPLLSDLINSPEIHRLRNMRQMNFDVPLIQELGRSRRLPHSIGVTHIAIHLAHKNKLDAKSSKILLAAAMLHDAAIPPYGHLVESELKISSPNFKHEAVLKKLINGNLSNMSIYEEIVPGKHLSLKQLLDKHDVDSDRVLELVSPKAGSESPISADIDIDNMDNVHRMAAMLGWHSAINNITSLLKHTKLHGLSRLSFHDDATEALENWLNYRQRIYTMIIAHKECIPYNALQTDLVRMAIEKEIITPERWFIPEPIFEERLRAEENSKELRSLADQLISGCQYHLIDYVWIKNFHTEKKLSNSEIVKNIEKTVECDVPDAGYFVWYEKALISRKIRWQTDNGETRSMGSDSRSCMIALIKKTSAQAKRRKADILKWRSDVISAFEQLSNSQASWVDFPEDYTGNFVSNKTNDFNF